MPQRTYLDVVQKPSYQASHDNIASGKPNLVRPPGGSLSRSKWRAQASVAPIEFRELRCSWIPGRTQLDSCSDSKERSRYVGQKDEDHDDLCTPGRRV